MGIGEVPPGEGAWELGALLAADPGAGIPAWVDAAGRLHTGGYRANRYPFSARRTVKWALAPARWGEFDRTARVRSIARRSLEGVRNTVGPLPVGEASADPQGWLLPEGGPGRVAIFSALHAPTSDQLVTRDPSEARELGYEAIRMLGYVFAIAPLTGSLERPRVAIPWASRFGERVTLSEDPLAPGGNHVASNGRHPGTHGDGEQSSLLEAIAPGDPVESGLERIRGDATRQLRLVGAAVRRHVSGQVPRFSDALPDQLSPGELGELERRVAELEPWLQGPFVLPGNLVVPGVWRSDEKWAWLAERLPAPAGKRALDIGANAGYDAFMLKRLGAREVIACEPHEFILQARFLESIYRTGVSFEQIPWQRLHREQHGRFDLIHCSGILYHEPHPLALLQKLRELIADDGQLVLGSMLHAASEHSEYLRFVPDAYAGDGSWWFVPGRLALRWMLEATGFEVQDVVLGDGLRGEFPTLNGFFFCRPAAAGAAPELEPPLGAAPPVRFPAGHYYSSMYDAHELAARAGQIWPARPRPTPGVDWREREQLELCRGVFAGRSPLALRRDAPEDPSEYWAYNDQYPPLDAWVLAAMVRHLRPARMIEIGSGFSSLITAQVNREELGNTMRFTCVEPYPRDFLLAGVPGITELRVEPVQATPLAHFESLRANDIVFVDTSHTVKTGGDVPWIFEEVIPRLARGVHVHVHDFFLPGDYPRPWVMEGWGWNELYLVRAFLSFNPAFEVVWGAQFMLQRHLDAVLKAFPEQRDFAERAGASLWFRRALRDR